MGAADPGVTGTDLPALAQRTTRERYDLLEGAPGAQSRRGRGWKAVRTRVRSNDANVVVSGPDASLDRDEVEDLVAWLKGVPASWHLASADENLAAMLLSLGAEPERTGWWCGRAIGEVHLEPSPWRVDDVKSDADVDGFLDVLAHCGWFESDERPLRRAQLASHPQVRHVVVGDGNRIVGAGTGFIGAALEIVDVAVLPDARRRGVGRAVVGDLVRWGGQRGAERVFAAPSPDGAELFRALGFGFEPVTPDVCFYLAG